METAVSKVNMTQIKVFGDYNVSPGSHRVLNGSHRVLNDRYLQSIEDCECNESNESTDFIIGLIYIYFINLVFLLLLCGDVESNPGPPQKNSVTTETYDIVKIVQASNHVEHSTLDQSVGLQCSPIALFSICWASVKRVAVWDTWDLDYILKEGNNLSKTIKRGTVSISNIPNVVEVGNKMITVDELLNEIGNLSFRNHTTFLLSSQTSHGSGLLFTINGHCCSIILTKKFLYLYDPHSKDGQGMITSNGKCLLLKFKSLKHVQNYIYNAYLTAPNISDIDFKFVCVKVNICKEDAAAIFELSKKCRDKERKCESRKRKQESLDLEKHEIGEIRQKRRKAEKRSEEYGSMKYEQQKLSNKVNMAKTRVATYGSRKHEQQKLSNKVNMAKTRVATYGSRKHEQQKLSNKVNMAKTRVAAHGSRKHEQQKLSNKVNMAKTRVAAHGSRKHKQLKLANKANMVNKRTHEKGSIKHLNQKLSNKANMAMKRHSIHGTAMHAIQKSKKRISTVKKWSLKIGTSGHRIRISKMKQYIASVKGTNKEEKTKNRRKRTNECHNTQGSRIKRFREAIKEGPEYICVSCNRCHFKRSVHLCDRKKYNIDINNYFTDIKSYDGKVYICNTCHLNLKKNKIPCQAVWNKLQVPDPPTFILNLRKLEKVIIAKRLLFKKIAIMPKGQQPKIKGAICNIINNAEQVSNILPRGMDNNGLILVKLKRKFCYRGHVLFESVRPDVIKSALQYLKNNNIYYQDIEIDESNIPSNLLSLEDDNDDDNTDTVQDNLEENDNPLDDYRVGAGETLLISQIPYEVENENLIIAPGEGKKPVSILTDNHCEELAFPHLLPTGKFGYSVQRDVALSPVRYFNQRLLNYKQRFASDSEYIFYAHSVLQQSALNSRINIAMQKVKGNNITAGMLSSHFKETVKSFIANDEAFSFMNSIKGTPAYWKRFLLEVLAMVKQLGLPTFFMTLSCADLRWDELIHIISKLEGKILSDEDVENLDYFERCNILNGNPVFTARNFQYRVEVFFKEIIINGPLGKVKHYAIRVEFQFRGSPHIHSFLWVANAPVLTKDTKEEYLAFIDHTVKAYLPDKTSEPELYNMVKTYQTHSHSKSCRKYKNVDCRYGFGKYFTDRTIIADPLPDEMSEKGKQEILQNREVLLRKVKTYIDSNLNPSKVNFLNANKPNYQDVKSIDEILKELEITKDEYYNALSISTDNDFQVHFKRPPNSCFINNYFNEGLMAWKANMDIQPVINHYKAVAYMCAYFSKSEDESSQCMKQAAKQAAEMNLNSYEQMKAIARAYVTSRECSVQEAVYHVMPELWLRKTFPQVIFANSNLPENRFRMFKSEEEIKDLAEDSTDVYKRNMIDRYIDIPNKTFQNGKYSMLDTLCFAEFLSHYYLAPNQNKETKNDNQPEVLQDEVLEQNHEGCNLQTNIPLMSSKDRLKCRKVKSVLRYHVPNKIKTPEKFAHHMLFMFYPFRNEAELFQTPSGTYFEKLSDSNVLQIVNENKLKFEPCGDTVDTVLSQLHLYAQHNQDSNAQQENDEVRELLQAAGSDEVDNADEDEAVLFNDDGPTSYSRAIFMPDDELNQNIRSLNEKQRELFEIVNKWARDYVKNLSCPTPCIVHPIHVFITGGGGCGKSHLVKTIYHSFQKTFAYKTGDPEKTRVTLLAPTGVAAVNINGTTVHSGLGIPVGFNGKCVPKLSDKLRSTLRNKMSEIQAIIIDEISMVSNILLLYVHQRLCEIFGCPHDNPFAGKTVIVVGDFYQLPPIMARPVYQQFNDPLLNLTHPWQTFKLCELTEIMRQREQDVSIF